MMYNRKKNCYISPINVNIEVTEKCDLNCKFCFKKSDGLKEIDFILLCRYLDQLAELGTPAIQFSGGDPLLYSYLIPAIRYAHAKGFYIRMSTSGKTFSLSYAGELKQAGLDTLHVSLNGSTESIHSETRDGFNYSIKAIDIAHQMNMLCVINWVANHSNVHDLENLIIIAKEMGVKRIDILSNKRNYDGQLFHPMTIEDTQYLKEVCEKYDDYVSVESCYNELRLLLYGRSISIIDKACKAGRFHIAIDVQGKLLPCPHLAQYAKDEKDIKSYWANDLTLLKFRQACRNGTSNDLLNMYSDSCVFCKNKSVCFPCYANCDNSIRDSVTFNCLLQSDYYQLA